MAYLLNTVLIPAFMAVCLLITAACGGGDPASQADEAQAALSTGDYTEARSQAEAGLKAAGSTDKNLAWKLERIRVEAIAKQGQGAEVLDTLTRLRAAHPEQCDAQFYAKVGNALLGAAQPVAAVQVADAGMKQFPDRKADFEGLIKEIQESGDSDALAMLKGLGYL